MVFLNYNGFLDFKTTSHSRLLIISLILVTLAMIFSCGMGHAAAASGSVIYVNSVSGHDSNNGYTWKTAKLTIKNAVAAVKNGGTVNIANGNYIGSGNKNINIKKSMTITGVNQIKTVINAKGSGNIFTINPGIKVTLQKLTLTHGTSSGQGGAIDNFGNLYVVASIFSYNSVIAHNVHDGGGAIYNGFGSTLNVKSSTFANNNVNGDYSGGAICSYGNNAIVTGSSFTGNSAGYGSAIYNDGPMTVISCVFNKNTATGPTSGYGVIYNDGNIAVNKCTFTGNSARGVFGDAGAIYNDGTLRLTSCKFTNNTSTGYSGAIDNAGNMNIVSCSFNFTKAVKRGGAVWNTANGTLNIINSSFYKNYGMEGGAILNNGFLKVTNSAFSGNTATDGNGGAIYSDGTLSVTGSTFTGNIATSIVGNGGGAIYNFGTGNVRFNRIIGNNNYDIYNAGSSSLDMSYNWWGTNFVGSNPITAGRVHGGTVNSWIVLRVGASSTVIAKKGSTFVTANLLYDNHGSYHSPTAAVVPYAGLANFKTSLGSISDVKFSNGVARSTLKAGTVSGVANFSTRVDGQTVNRTVKIT